MTQTLAMLDATDSVIANSTFTFSHSFEIKNDVFTRPGLEFDDMPDTEKQLVMDFISMTHTIKCEANLKTLTEKNNLIKLFKGSLPTGKVIAHDKGLKFVCDNDYPTTTLTRVWMTNLDVPPKTGAALFWRAKFDLVEGEGW